MSRGRSIGALALVVGTVAAILLHGRPSIPPIYDGIIVPPAPYRYESPPPNVRNGNQKPLGGQATLPVSNGQVSGGGVQTDDAQVIMFFGVGTFKVPPGATSVQCSIEPDPNPPAPPAGIDIRGNVYRIGCLAQPGGAPVTLTGTFHLTMRLPPGATNDIRYHDGQSWHTLITLFAPGGDPYASVNAAGFGEYAAMARTGAQGSGDNIFSTLGRYAEFYGILAFVIIFGVIAVVQELRRRRQQQVPKPRPKR
jgi:hypothetical protein